ncbi:nucleoporin p58/p45 [Sporothrix schenckii 1099-18]|uniref:Nucleoporin p58/p45 n=1 Tax=Sporothrix schenckii 1099-18 TaxID=1397361 RepID=A0A0F2MHI7_SPOSC|nr:nucleoporin p58/p45 [Sporothrix schenckii 1099-18]KJR88325.1 nucleoporin p58/p45 [Sporothrix schenckii 1099-18]
MALARSASVPGGLSINTGAANLFGSTATSQAPASSGLFGSATTQTAAKPAGGLFGSPATATPAPATSTPPLFGGGTATTTAAPAAGGLFGGGATTAAAAQPAKPALGGLFGGGSTTTTTTAAPATGGGLFGGGTATAPATTGGGLFSASTTTAQPAAATGGLFGASTTTPAAAAPSTMSGGLFGTTAQQPQQQQQQQQAQQQQQQVVPGVRIDLSNLKGTTRFNDLQESLQKDIIAFDTMIQSFIEQKNQVEAFLPAHSESLEAIPGDVRFVARKYDGVSGAMASDLQSIQTLRETVKQDAEHAQLSFKVLDNQKLPAQFHTSGLWSTTGGAGGKKNGRGGRDGVRGGDDGSDGKAGSDRGGDGGGRTDLINYFSHTGDEIGSQLRKLESNLGEIEVHMYSVQAGLLEQLQRVAASSSNGSSSADANGDGGSSASDKVAELAAVLRDFEESILTVASLVGSARESMTGLQLGGFLGRR